MVLGLLIGLIAGALGGNLTKILAGGKYSMGRNLNTIVGIVGGLFAAALYSSAGGGIAGILYVFIQALVAGFTFAFAGKLIRDKMRKKDSE